MTAAPDLSQLLEALARLDIRAQVFADMQGVDAGVSVNPDLLRDRDTDLMYVEWDPDLDWVMTECCMPGVPVTVALDVPSPGDPSSVAAIIRAVLNCEITEFRTIEVEAAR